MERIYQMNVVPDVVPDLRPTLDLQITFPIASKSSHRGKLRYETVEPGVYLLPEQVRRHLCERCPLNLISLFLRP
jgi:large subunit ribosomal protein L35